MTQFNLVTFKKGFYADVRIEDRFNTNITFVNKQLRECKENTVKKAFLRVYDGNMWYYASTSDLNNLQAELDSLYDCAQFNQNIDDDPTVKLFEVNKEKVVRFEQQSVRKVPLAEKLAHVTATMENVKSQYLRLQSSGYADRNSMYTFISSKGAAIAYDFQTAYDIYSVSMSHQGQDLDDRLLSCALNFQELVQKPRDFAKFIQDAEYFLLNAKPCQAGQFPVILSPEATGIFAHESFGHKSEADFMVGDETAKKEWAIGKKVGSEILSIYDTGTIDGSGYVPFDDEGTRAKKTYLIKDGKLVGRLHSVATAAALGEMPTGNARAINADYEPIVRMTSTNIAGHGNQSFDDLVSKVKFGYFIQTCKHGSGMSTFTIAPNKAYEIVDGKLGKPVRIAVITGNVFETLGLIDGVSKTERLADSGAGGCGKMEQSPLNVSFGGPYLSISKMNVQ